MYQGSEKGKLEVRWHPTPEILIVALNFNLTMKWVVTHLKNEQA